MISCYRGNETNQRPDEIGCVETAAKSYFDNANVDTAPREIDKRHGGDKFKKRQSYAGGGEALIELTPQRNNIIFRDFLVADSDAFGKRY